jgi:cobalt/nickel transport system permease protein
LTLPEWLKQAASIQPCPCCTLSGPSRKNITERTTRAFSDFFDESNYVEGYVSKRGFLQFVDPRFKLIGLLWLVVCVIFVARVEWVLATIGVTILLAAASRLRLGSYLKRVWLFIPLFTQVIAVPAMFNFVIPGQPLLVLLSKGEPVGPFVAPWTISITIPGVQGAVLFVLRTGATVSLVILLALTTPWTDLLASLQSLKVPAAFVMILSMTYRYVSVLVGIARDMSMALRSRTLRAERSIEVTSWLSAVIGVLFRRSMNMSELVSLSMISRGYDGKVRSVSRFHAQSFDWAFLAFLFGLGMILLMLRNVALLKGI